jgi:PAS domain S-box-containing protein
MAHTPFAPWSRPCRRGSDQREHGLAADTPMMHPSTAAAGIGRLGLPLAFAVGTALTALLTLLPLGPMAWLAPDFLVVAAFAACLLLRRKDLAHGAQAQQRAAQMLQTLADTTSDAVFAKDREGRYLLFNHAACKAACVDAQSVLGQTDAVLFPALHTEIRERDLRVLQQDVPQTYEETLDTPRGKRTFLTTKGPLRDERGVFGLFGIARDITEMVLAREQLQQSEQRFRLAAAGGDVWDWNIAAGKAVSQSSFWRRLGFEPPADSEAAQWLPMLMHSDDRQAWQQALREHLRDRKPYAVEFRARQRNGGWRWFRTQGQALWNEHGRATYMAGTTYDVTDRREAEEVLQTTRVELSELSQRLMQQEREMTKRLAHSLHDQLGQVLGSARLHLDVALAHPDDPTAARCDRLNRVSTLIDHAVTEVRRVLVDLRPPVLNEQGLGAALDNEIRHGAQGLNTQVLLHIDARSRAGRWPEAVEYAAFMVAREALSNALKHAQARRVHVSLVSHGEDFELRVDDDGVGIAETRRNGVAGHLGLVGMRERAASIGGLFTVERRLSGGTTVCLIWRGKDDE